MGSRSSPLLVNFGPGASPQSQKVKNFGNAHLVDGLCDRAEILHCGRPKWVAGQLSFWWTLAQGLARSRSKGPRQNFESKYLENADRCEVKPKRALICRTHELSIAPSDLTLDDLEGSKIKVILFDVKYVKNGKKITMLNPWASLRMTLRGQRSRSQKGRWRRSACGIYASPNNWHTCLYILFLFIYQFYRSMG